MFVRMCPDLPSSACVCLNQLHGLANRMGEEGVDLQRCVQSSFRTYLGGLPVVMVAEFGILGCEAQRSASPATKSE
jgi:hypothetical protein